MSVLTMTTTQPKFLELKKVLHDFVHLDCIPAEKLFYQQLGSLDSPQRWKIVPPIIEDLKTKARSLGLWNLFLSSTTEYGKKYGPGNITHLEYAQLCELMGKSFLCPEATNCSAPDTGNMEVLAKYGSEEQKKQWLEPLLRGDIRSAFAMTEPAVASSDATNIETEIRFDSTTNEYIVHGRKWWISGAGDPRCRIYLVMGKTDTSASKHLQQSVILVPADTPGITVVRPLTVFGYDDAPHGHCEVVFDKVRVRKENIILGPGRGFEIIQGRLGPGRIHHCMRQIGLAERALEYHLLRVTHPSKKTFGKFLYQHGDIMTGIAQSRIDIDAARLLVLNAAHQMDVKNAKGAMKEIAIAKAFVPRTTCQVIDRAIQAHGAAGVGQDFPLAYMYAASRTLRIADGPDEVHMMQIAKLELSSIKKQVNSSKL